MKVVAAVLTLWAVALVGNLICDSLDLLSYKRDIWSSLKNLALILVTGVLGLLFAVYVGK
jgi:hypothetical protein